MAMSSGVRQVLGLSVGWLLVAATAAAAVLHLAEIKDAARGLLGHSPTPSEAPAAGQAWRQGAFASRLAVGRVVELRAGAFGHYRAQAEINGRPVEVLVDSGASLVVLSHEDAERAGLRPRAQDYTQRVSTANGVTRVAPMLLDRVSIGDISVHNVEAAIGEPGKLGQSLLGMTFLGRLQRVDMRAGVLFLQE
ncbi:MAG TPA: TIGR02281 family clan AA aspartic protease [Hyphomicrobiaceae bacterium]|jgi:aspartyl protease family protein|nr:TIGR02281 family clan AA aspartic protease [Hyphomicrobiaceae bacterium]